MIDRETRTAIVRLCREGHSIRAIAQIIGLSRNSVREVLRSGEVSVPPLEREAECDPHLDRIRELHAACAGNRVRVWEELRAAGVDVAYSTLTHFCRRHGIGLRAKRRAGRYHFAPGEEMQHDTSPHTVEIGGRKRAIQCASLVLCYSRMLFAKGYLRWRRFECRSFLTEALTYFQGSAARCMVDNSSVVLLRGSGRDAEVAPEMEALARRFGFSFVAHELGDANRSARVERPFYFIERNFYPGRSFTSLADLNQQLRAWCDRVNARPKREIEGTPIERLVTERPALTPLPPYVPPIYEPHTRRVDVEGYVSLYANRYSVPTALIGRRVEVREYEERIRVFEGHELVVEHTPLEPGLGRRVTLPEHLGETRRRKAPPPPSPEEKALRAAAPEFQALIEALRKRHGGRAARAVRDLYRIYLDYPLPSILPALRSALAHGLTDLGRIERMILKTLQGEFFRLSEGSEKPSPPEEIRDDG